MAEMHLDSSDLVGSLDGFENLEHIQGDFDTYSESHEEIVDDKNILPHDVEEMDMMSGVHPEEAVAVVIKDEDIEKMEEVEMETEESLMMGDVRVEHILTVDPSGQELFPGEIIEEVVGQEEPDKMYDEIDSMDHFAGEEVIADSEEVVTEEVIDDTTSMEVTEPEQVIKTEPPSSNVVSSGVYVVATSNSNIVSAQSLIPATNTLFTPTPKEKNSGNQQTIRIVSGGKVMGSQARTITLAQARQMGLFTQSKVGTFLPATILPKPNTVQTQQTVVTKPTSQKKPNLALVKSPTKILPVPAPSSPKQKVVIRQGGGVVGGAASGQVIRIPAKSLSSQAITNLTQIQLPGKQVQYVKLVSGGGGKTGDTPTKTMPVTMTSSLINSSPAVFKLVPIAAPQPQVVQGRSNVVQVSSASPTHQSTSPVPSSTGLVVIPSQVLTTPVPQPPIQPAATTKEVKSSSPIITSTKPVVGRKPNSIKKEPIIKTERTDNWSGDETTLTPYEANGIRPRKPCNCTKSMCLKLYCDCFANGEFCNQCNCTCCSNNLDHEEERQRAIKSCLERNPTAFKPKIGKSFIGSEERRHNKGCNCRRSGCLKNYCECYEAKIPCSRNCKCVGCKNLDSPFVLRRDDDPRVMQSSGGSSGGGTLLRLIKAGEAAVSRPPSYITSIKHGYSMISNEVVEATCQCLLAQAEDWEERGSSQQTSLDVAQSLIIEEFSRCIVQIIECVAKSTSSLTTNP